MYDGARDARGAVALALHFDIFVVACACTVMRECYTGAKEFRAFTRTASGFPHYETVAYKVSRVFAALAAYAFVLLPALYATVAAAHGASFGGAFIANSPQGALVVGYTASLLVKSAHALVAHAQDAHAERAIRDRILHVATSADI